MQLKLLKYDSIIDYLLKPIELPRFIKAVQKVENHLSIANGNTNDITIKNDFYVNIDRRLIKIDLHSIYIIEAKGDYINIRTEEKNYIVHFYIKKNRRKTSRFIIS